MTNDEDHDSEGCSSTEEDIEPPTTVTSKKAIEVIEEEVSPVRVITDIGSTIGCDSPLETSRLSKGPRDIINLRVTEKYHEPINQS